MSWLELEAALRWVVWKLEERQGRKTKVPYSPITGRKAASSKPKEWTNHKGAATACSRLGGAGTGLMLGDHAGLALGGIDLDTCRDPLSGTIEPWAVAVIDRIASYTEVSPSGTGVKVFFAYDAEALPEMRRAMGTATGKQFKRGTGEHPPSIELYLSGRYFAVTRQALPDLPAAPVQVPTATLLWLIQDAGPDFATLEKRGTATTGKDGSRSAQAFRVGVKVRRNGGSYDDFKRELKQIPATAAWLTEKGLPNEEREARRIWDRVAVTRGDPSEVEQAELTEHGVAEEFAKQRANLLRFCHHASAWYVWAGSHWQRNETQLAFSWARWLTAELNRSAEFKTKAITGRAAFAAAVERFAQADERFAVTSSRWDRNSWLLGTPRGTVDLRTGILHPAVPADHISKVTAVAPTAAVTCPTWLRFLHEATAGDSALIRFLQQWVGYCLTAETCEHALLFIYGSGGNGKTVFLDTVSNVLGDYCATAAMETFTATHGDRHPTDLAMLRGARMVCASETEEGHTWAEARIKQITGGDEISARFMRRDFFSYRPQFKLTIAGNHKPALKSVDEAIRRRLNIVPFTVQPPRKDPRLVEKLRAEWPGILRWAIEGCLDWQQNGLIRPGIVSEATEEYFEAQDVIGRWMGERCIKAGHLEDKPARLLADCREWAMANGEVAPTSQQFRGALEKVPGLRYKTVKGMQRVTGLSLQPPRENQEEGQKCEAGVEEGGGSPD